MLTNAQIWAVMILLFLLVETAIVQWSNVSRARLSAGTKRRDPSDGDETKGAR